MHTKTVTVRLDPSDYERLALEAKRLDMSPGALARAYVRASLVRDNTAEAEQRRQAGRAALEGLARLRERLPDAGPIDAAQLVREGREGLDQRTML